MQIVRRAVSGQNTQGKSILVSDQSIEGLNFAAGAIVHQLWGSDEPPQFPQMGECPKYESFFPALGGYRFTLLTILPSPDVKIVRDKSDAPTQKPLNSDLQNLLKADKVPGMHRTDTVDLIVILEGEAELELDDGERLSLKAGDVFIQNGTRHRWLNHGSVPVRMAGVSIGGVRP